MQLPKKKSKLRVKKEIIEFLKSTCGLPSKNLEKYPCGTHHRNCLVLATCHTNVPRATTLEFFNEGLTIYIFAEPGGKIANIKRNPRVSAAVYQQPLDHALPQKSLQIFGMAELINMKNNPRVFKTKAKKWNLYVCTEKLAKIERKGLTDKQFTEKVEKALSAFNFIKIVPHRIIVREYYPDFSMPKYEWSK